MSDVQKERLKESGVFDENSKTIHIANKDHLSREEYDALLVSHTGNTSAYSFAAEVKYHSDRCDSWDVFGYGKAQAVISNTGIGESNSSKIGIIGDYATFESESGHETRTFKNHGDDEFSKSHGWVAQPETNPDDDPPPPTPGETDPKPV